ncbi:hypothetical protein YA0868_01925 [Pseudomonas syringae]|uniref:hypothetical protein n=1 Tax=Pseudomonas syringae TaxID=317 RepID=UPI0018E5B52E|nr:hypothetical protein [Pseudomonas syringae]MBI6558099.1 hypothetical protein [Pseudomonas syringae]MBI6569192.1 hypothetical protein [Pseudomonas syringae]MBI6585193.1 hypothetical protein [Pseudomonas syringae]MBI6595749.1 hypothetical protein [Pseudomonas syringae]
MRQWDTKRQFKPRYGAVFKGFLLAWVKPLANLAKSISLSLHSLADLLLGILLLVLSPVMLPVFLIAEKRLTRRRRLDYLIAQRLADKDI